MHKIAYLVSVYPAVSHTFIYNEIQALRSRGVDLDVISINHPEYAMEGDIPEVLAEEKTTFYVKQQSFFQMASAFIKTVVHFPRGLIKGIISVFKYSRGDLKQLLWNFFYLLEAVIIGVWMQQKGIQHVHAHFANAGATVALFVSLIFDKSFSMTVHGPDEFFEVSKSLLKEKIEHAKFIVCIGQFSRSQLMRIAPYSNWDKLRVCPLGVDLDVFKPKNLETIDRVEILCVGRLVPAKGQAILLKAVAELVKENFYLRVRLVGEGVDRKPLEALADSLNITPFIEFLGSRNHLQVQQIFEESDLFVLPTFAEGIPIVLMEAMAKEIPCITTWVNGIPELIQNKINGITVAPSDHIALKEAIKELILDQSLRESIGKHARKTLTEHYNLKTNIEKLKEIYHHEGVI